jgi:subtilisin family serine protease
VESTTNRVRADRRVPTGSQLIGLSVGIVLLLLTVWSASSVAAEEKSNRELRDYIVVLETSVEHPGAVAEAQTARRDGDLKVIYRHALNGYAATLRTHQIESLREDPRVAFVTPDHEVSVLEEEVELETEENSGIEVLEATIPTGISRIFALTNKGLDIDGKDDLRANVDVAVLDTGIDYEHPDLNVVARTSCITGTCIDSTGKDGHSHGTHVAGTIGAIDNSQGVVGVAPGARMWGVKVLNDGGSGSESWIIAGVDWATARASEIEVANLSLGCFCSMPALDKAINSSVEAGIVYAVAAGNSNANVSSFSPASNPNVITVSALADYDGLPGGKSAATCQNYGLDDRKASFSNYGSGVEIVAPGVCTLSTIPGNKYGYKSGTSMASPHVAGAAAILASASNPASKKDTEAIRETLIKAGSKFWTDTSGDGIQEPLLDVSNEVTFRLVSPPTYSSSFGAWGTGNGQFVGPSDAEVHASSGDIWVADRANHRIQKFNSKGEYLSKFGSEGTGTGQFKSPVGVTIDQKGNIWVADSGNARLQKFNSKGEFLLKCGSQGTGNGQFSIWGPKGIAVDSGNNIWVTDSSGRVQKFTESCGFLKSIGSYGTGAGQFVESSGIDIGAGKIWVGDWVNDRVSVFNEAGEYLFKFGSEGTGNGQFKGIGGVEIDSRGNVWVLDGGNDRVQQFNQAGEYLTQFGSSGSGAGQFDFSPSAELTSDGKGALWIADDANHRIQKWLVP